MNWSRFWNNLRLKRAAKAQRANTKPTLEVLEDRTVPTTLSLAIAPGTFAENAGAAAAIGTVTRSNTNLANPLTVNLTSSDTTEATVPAQVIIAAGDTSATFPIDAVDDALADGSQTVQISAAANDGTPTVVGLDSSFGVGGYRSVPMQVQWSSNFPDVAIQPDGKIVAVADAGVSNAVWAVSRVLADGTPDATFGTGGSLTTTISGSTDGEANGVVIQPDGKILVLGKINGGSGVHDDWAVARYNVNGALDSTFGSGGTLRIERPGFNGWLYDAKVLANGQILLGGYWSEGFAVMRLTGTGQVDTSFGTTGWLPGTSKGMTVVDMDTTASNNGLGYSLVVQPDGKILLAGDPNNKGFGVIRLNTNGTLDTTFSGDGIQVISTATFGATYQYARAASVKVQTDGKILLGGSLIDTNFNGNFGIARLNANGTLDTTFSGDGVAAVDFNGGDDLVNDMVVQDDGKIILAGYGFLSPNGRELGLMRFNVDGSLDTSFDGDGKYTAPSLPSIFEAIWAAKLQPDGKLVALAGYNTDIRVGRFNINNGNSSASASITVTDDEPAPTLTVTINATDIYEHAGTSAAVGTVTRGNMSFANSLTVTLASSDTTEATVPSQVVIPAGQASANFAINAVDDTITDGTQPVTITASIAPANPGQATLNVRDNEPFSAASNSYSLSEDTTLTVNAANGVLTNDTITAPINPRSYIYNGAGHGTVNLAADGSFTYTPNANFFGIDGFSYRIYDGSAISNIATVTLNIAAVNDAPVAANDSYTVAEDQTLNVGNGGSTQGQTSVSMVSDPGDWIGQGGTYNFNSSFGTYSVTAYGASRVTVNLSNPNTYWYFDFGAPTGQSLAVGTYLNAIRFGDATHPEIDITTSGRGSNQTTGKFTVLQIVYGANNQVLRFAVNFEQHSEGAVPALRGTLYYNYLPSDGILLNDTDVENSPLTVALVSAPTHGSLNLNSNGSFTYTPTANYNGPDSFTYKANDGQLDSNVATVSLNVTPVNDAPVAANDVYATDEDTPLTVSAPGVLANDNDVDGNALTAALVAGPSHGSVTLNGDGSFTYTPSANYSGGDTFTYKANDGALNSNVATVSLTINPINDAPVAADDAFTTSENTPLTVSGAGVLVNDGDVEGDALTAALVAGPSHGAVTFNSDGTFTYTPAANYNGSDSFTYKANDGALDSNVATVSLTINAVNSAPLAVDDEYTTDEDMPLTVSAAGVLANDSDAEGDTLTAVLVAGPSHGSVTLNDDGSFTYAPAANYNGNDSFTYNANDGALNSNVATVSLTISAVSDAPAAAGDAYTTNEDAPLTVSAAGVLANDSDADGDALTAAIVAGPSHGALTFNSDGSFTYTPAANYNGSDSFTYKANDGALDSNVATVSLTVSAVNDAPVAANDAFATDEDAPLTVSAPGVLANDSDVEGDTLTAVLVAGPSHGSVTLNDDGSFTYTPAADYNGSDSFTYKSNDGALDSNVATVSLTINAVNDAPAAADNGYTTNEDTPLTVSAPGVLANDSDLDSDALTAAIVAGPSHRALTFNSDGSFTYAPAGNYNGSDSFTYKANDGGLDSNVATVSLTINAVNDAPAAANEAFTTNEDTPRTVSAPGVLANDSDIEGDTLTAVLVAGPSHGALTFNSDGSFTYTPTANYNGSDTFTYKANDGTLNSNVATVSLTINAVNDPPVANAGPDQSANEGASVAFDGSASSDVDGDALTYAWTFGDGGTASGAKPSHVFADNGNYTVTLTVNDGHGGSTSDTVVVTVGNVAPTASLSGPATGVRGQARTFTFAATDPSPVDQAAPFTFSVIWGDGATQTIVGQSAQNADHVFTTTGSFTLKVTATDKNGGVSVIAQQVIVIKAVDLQGATLAVGGTTADDNIVVKPADSQGNLNVSMNNVDQGTFAPPAQLLVYGQAGNDNIQLNSNKIRGITYYVAVPAALFGDAGNDSLDARGSSADNILAGGAGGDTLQGGPGSDILLGGLGADNLKGNGGDDIVIGNATDFDSNLAALLAMMTEWSRTDINYQTRVNHLNGTVAGGQNGSYFFTAATVHDDAAIDQLYGGSDSDWFFATGSGANKDKVNDAVGGEGIVTL